MRRIFIVKAIVLLMLLFSANILAATYYVNGTNGNDLNDGSSVSNAKQSVSAGLTLLDNGVSGDVLIIMDGIYRERITISASGNSMAYKVVKAQNPGKVIIDGEYHSEASTVTISGDYVKVIGIKFINGGAYGGQITSSSDHAYIKDCAFIGADATNANSEVFRNNGSYALIEDTWFAGGGRYLVNDRGGNYNVYRRCLGRWDYSAGSRRIGGFMNNHLLSIGGSNAVYQNSIAIDFNDPIGHDTWLTGGFADIFGHNITRAGCIAMNIVSSDNTGSSALGDKAAQRMVGFFDEPSEAGRNGTNVYENCLALNSYSGYRQVRSGNTTISNFTAINSSTSAVGSNESPVLFTNSLFIKNSEPVSGTATYSYSHFQDEAPAGTNQTTGDAGLLYPVRIESGSVIDGTGENGGDRGATIMKRIGVEGAHYGRDGWNTITNIDLWPFPNQARIQADFREVPAPPSGAIPTTSNSYRGFCAEGQTLTKYIWEALGNSFPPTTPNPPSGLVVE